MGHLLLQLQLPAKHVASQYSTRTATTNAIRTPSTFSARKASSWPGSSSPRQAWTWGTSTPHDSLRLETSPSSQTCPFCAIKTWGAATCGSKQTRIAQRPLNRQLRNVACNIDWGSCNYSIHRVGPFQSLRQARKSHVRQKVTSHVDHDVYN